MDRFRGAVNTQPWIVHVVRGSTKSAITQELLAARENKQVENPDYHYYPHEWFEPYKARRKSCGKAMYSALNIEYGDKERRMNQWNHNYHFFDAPVGLFFFLHKTLNTGSWLDMGMFIENVMLTARAYDLGTCAQASLADYPDIVREILHVSNDYSLVCGMALGYPDNSAPVNNYRTEREPLNNFVYWHEN